jgi:hypothetical protein
MEDIDLSIYILSSSAIIRIRFALKEEEEQGSRGDEIFAQ